MAAEQRAAHRGWVAARNECALAADVRACVALAYRTRIVELQITSGQLPAITPTVFACTGGDRMPFLVTMRATDPPSAVIASASTRVIAFSTPAASGAKYVAPGVEFWEHQGEATVTWFGATIRCRTRPLPSDEPGTSPRSLEGTSWELVRFQSSDGTTLTPTGFARYALAFAAGGRVQVQADCNKYSGTWKSAPGGALTFGPTALTRTACKPSALEPRFGRDLARVRSYVVRDGQLLMSLAAGAGVYTFAPAR
jgi:heat shock protein HslJ